MRYRLLAAKHTKLILRNVGRHLGAVFLAVWLSSYSSINYEISVFLYMSWFSLHIRWTIFLVNAICLVAVLRLSLIYWASGAVGQHIRLMLRSSVDQWLLPVLVYHREGRDYNFDQFQTKSHCNKLSINFFFAMKVF